MPTNRPFKRGDILEIVRPENWWDGGIEQWKGRFVIVSQKEGERYTFKWMSGAPPAWHNKELFALGRDRVESRNIFKKVGRAKL